MKESVSLGTFEAFVRDRRHEDALTCLAAITHALEHGNTLTARTEDAPDEATAYTRLAAAITTLFADPKLRISPAGFAALLLRNRVFAGIFAAGGYSTADHVLRLMKPKPSAPKSAAWLLQPLESLDDQAFSHMARMKPSDALRIVIALLCQRVVPSEAAETNRARLLALGPHIESGVLDPADVETAVNAWMICSYSDLPNKHDFKGHLAKVFRRFVGAIPPPAVEVDADRDKPVLAVLSEHFNPSHAMYRCYARSIAQLRRDFHVVLFTERDHAEAKVDEVDEVVIIDFDVNEPHTVVQAITDVAPDVVYYPSIGMAAWTVVLANVRLAPIQIMSLGHPASSRSEVIDYVVTEEDHAGDPSDYTETLVLMASGGHPFVPGDKTTLSPTIREHADPFRIAVPSNALKLSWRFFEACQTIESRAGRPVEFHFFPNLRGVTLRQVEEMASRWVSRFVVHPPTDYASYLEILGTCDLHLSTFPFGGTNSNVDTMRLGIPMVALDGTESAAAGDVKMLRRLGFERELVVPTVAAYVERAVELIQHDDRRVELSQRIVDADAHALFCEGRDAVNATEFSDTVKSLFDRSKP